MSEVQRFSLHKVKTEGNSLVNQQGELFDTHAFSRFKHGSNNEAITYGSSLSHAFEIEHPELFVPDAELIVTASISKFLPLASDRLADAFYNNLNYSLHKKGLPSADRVKIHRQHLVEGDYSSFNEQERLNVVNRDNLSLPDEVVEGKHLLVIDDLRMTGFHERKIDEYVQNLDVLSVWYLYAVQMHEEDAAKDPTLESRMNKAYVRDLETLKEVVTARDFLINSRVCKFVIDYKDSTELAAFLSAIDTPFLFTLFTGALGNGYNRMTRYNDSISMIEDELITRGVIVNDMIQAPLEGELNNE